MLFLARRRQCHLSSTWKYEWENFRRDFTFWKYRSARPYWNRWKYDPKYTTSSKNATCDVTFREIRIFKHARLRFELFRAKLHPRWVAPVVVFAFSVKNIYKTNFRGKKNRSSFQYEFFIPIFRENHDELSASSGHVSPNKIFRTESAISKNFCLLRRNSEKRNFRALRDIVRKRNWHHRVGRKISYRTNHISTPSEW